MKLYSINELDQKTDSEFDEILTKRATNFIKDISKSLKGKHIDAFGTNGNGLWGQDPNLLDFEITKVKLTNDYVVLNGNKIDLAIDVYLKGYDDNKAYGMMYTDEVAEKSFKKLFAGIFGKEAKISWSEEGMQGDKYVNLDFQIPTKLLAPDLQNYQLYQEKIEKLKESLDSELKIKKPKIK